VKSFGFTTHKGRQIDFDRNDREVARYILDDEPSFSLCIACGACAATCTAGRFTEFSLRRLNILVMRGENDEVRKTIDRCMLCGKCNLVCPRGVNTRNVLFLMRRAFEKLDNHAV